EGAAGVLVAHQTLVRAGQSFAPVGARQDFREVVLSPEWGVLREPGASPQAGRAKTDTNRRGVVRLGRCPRLSQNAPFRGSKPPPDRLASPECAETNDSLCVRRSGFRGSLVPPPAPCAHPRGKATILPRPAIAAPDQRGPAAWRTIRRS